MGAVALRDGGRMVFEDTGAGRPLVFIHGWATHGGFFEPQRAALSRSHRVITVDLRGHGRSQASSGTVSIAQLANDVAELFAELDLVDAVAIGWSMGAMVLWDAIHRHIGHRVGGLVVEDMSPCIMNVADWQHGLADGFGPDQLPGVLQAMTTDWQAFCEISVVRMFARGRARQRDALPRWAVAELGMNDPHTMAALWRSMAEQDFRDTLAKIHTPTLVAYGEHSQLYGPGTSAAIVETMPVAMRVGFARSGHAPHLEEPDEFNRLIECFSEMTGCRMSADFLRPSAHVP